MRTRLFQILFRSGLIRFFKLGEMEYPILCFHRVHPTYDPFTQPLDPEAFEEMINGLMKHYTIVPLHHLMEGQDLPKNACVLTFDDALLDFYAHAFPILLRHQVPVTLFVPTVSIETGEELYNYALAGMMLTSLGDKADIPFPEIGSIENPSIIQYLQLSSHFAKSSERDILLAVLRARFKRFVPLLAPPMSWDQLREVKDNGVAIGGHSHVHAWLPSMTEAEIEADLMGSLRLLKQHLDVDTRWVAYPMGGYDDKVERVMAKHGLIGFGTQGRCYHPLTDSPLHIPRFNVSDRSYEEMLFRMGGFHRRLGR